MKRSGDALHMTALLAPEPGIPIEIFDGNAALHMVIVDRQSVTAPR